MKKFLSLVLAILMVVSMVPTFLFSIAAQGSDATDNAVASEFPKLIITEVHPNSINYNSNQAGWVTDAEIGDIFYPTPGINENYYYARNPAVGADVSAYYELVEQDGNKVFVRSDDLTAKEGVNYYSTGNTSGNYDVFEYIEIYNSGTEPVDLYQYKIMYDRDSTYDQNNDVRSTPMHTGGVSSSYHKSHFEKVVVKEGESVSGYYTKNSAESFTPCAADAVAVAGTEYYRLVEGEYYVENPKEAWLNPGECAVIWFYTGNDWVTCQTTERFKTYYEWRYSEAKRGSYGVDLSDTLVLAIDAWTDTGYFGVSGAFDLQDAGSRIYGIAEQTMTDTVDTARYDKWESWVFWSAYSGIDLGNTAKAMTVDVGVTKVTGGDVAVYLEDIGAYVFPDVNDGTADANGCAVLGLTYYKVNINDGSNKSPYANKTDTSSGNFLYGFNDNAPLKEGWPYTVTNWDLSPGNLTNVQKDVLPCGKTETSIPEIVITEVCPDSVGADAYEYLEVTNTSGAAINIYDYTVLVRTSSYQNSIGNEYFNRFNTIIPGNVGNILAADPGSYYYDKAPTNPEYDAGWLQPGETAVLWSYYSEAYAANATFDDFRANFGLDSGVKIFAMDSDNSARTGRPNERQNLGNSGFYLYGLARNDDLLWYSDPYVSNVVMSPITFVTGTTQQTALGIPLEDAVSYVMANSLMVSGQNTGLGEGYGYQFVWDRVEGTNNKFGALLDIAKLTRYDTDTKFVFSGSVIDDQWLSSPGKLIEAQKTSMTTNTGADRYVVYMKDFDGIGNVAGYNEVAELLGMTGVTENAILNDEHLLNVKETEAKGIHFLEVRDGKLYINNYGSSDDYMLLMSDDVLDTLRDGNFTVEFSMTYDGAMINGNNGYSTVLYNFDGENLSYGSSIVRVSGYGNNAVYMNNQMFAIEDASTTAGAGANMNGTNLNGSATLYELLTKKDVSKVGGGSTLDGSVVLAGKTLNVKVDVSITTGVTVTVNDIVVSKSYDVVDSAMFSNWGIFLEQTIGSDIVLKTTPNVSVSYDYITVYTDAVGTNADDMDIPELYITEMMMDGSSWIFRPNDTASTYLGWIEYIEITNGSDKPVALKDYTLVTTNRDSGNADFGRLHEGNNLKWTGDYNNGGVNLGDWLGTGDCIAKLTKDGAGCDLYNPSENEAVLQPGESVVIFTTDTNTSFQQVDYDGKTTDFISAAKSWLKLSDEVLCMALGKKSTVITDVDPETLEPVGNPTRTRTAFNNWNSQACVYGIGHTYDEDGNAIDWKNTYTHDYRYIVSFVNFLPAIAIGQNNTGYSNDDTGYGGAPLQGYPFHFTYGLDNSTYYKQGTVFTRRQNPAIHTYKSGTTTVDKKGQYNVGKLYQVQQTAFNKIRELARNGFDNEGGLVITEYIPFTNDNHNTGYEAFEAMEITNTASYAINLYDYALAKADDGLYGNPNSWGLMDTLRAGVPVSRYYCGYDQLQYISNPEDGMVQPGETIVLWFYTTSTYNYAKAIGANNITVEEFRQYWADRDNDVINATNENEEYTTKVIVVPHIDTHSNLHQSFNMYNNATTNYGIAKKTQFAFGNTIARAGSIVSSVFAPVFSMYYDLGWKLCQLNPSIGYLPLESGSLSTSFTWDELLVEAVDLAAETNPSNLCVRNEDGSYSFASAPYDEGTTYYKLYFYANVQSINHSDVDDLALNFVYGSSMTSGWNQGAALATVKADYYVSNGNGNYWSTSSDDADLNPHVQISMTSTGVRANSLGYLIEEQKGMIASTNFDYVGELDDGTNVYFYETVAGDLSALNVLNGGASVNFSGSGTEISFSASVSTELYTALTEAFGEEHVSVGIITVRAEDALKASMIRPAVLEAAGIEYVIEDDLDANVSDGRRHFYSSAQKLQEGYYADTLSAVGFVRVETCMGAITLYSNTADNQSATQVLASAVVDYSDVETEEYCYQVASGKWSRYTAEQRERFEALCAR